MRKVLFLLGQLNDSDLEWMLANGHKERLQRGVTLIQEGQAVEALYILLAGTLEVSGAGIDPKNPIKLICGDVVGEVSFVDSRPPSANVKAGEEAVVLAVPRSALTRKIESEPEFAARFYRSIAVFLAQRLRNTMHHLGYGKAQPLRDEEQEDELGDDVLDSLHLAGHRFDRVLQQLLTS